MGQECGEGVTHLCHRSRGPRSSAASARSPSESTAVSSISSSSSLEINNICKVVGVLSHPKRTPKSHALYNCLPLRVDRA